MLRLKIVYGKEARRLAIEEPITLNKVLSVIKESFQLKNFTVKYVDDEQEQVNLQSQGDFEEATRLLEDLKIPVLKLFVYDSAEMGAVETNAVVDEPEPEKPVLPTIHEILAKLRELATADEKFRDELPEAAKIAVASGYLAKKSIKEVVSDVLTGCPGIGDNETVKSWDLINNWEAILGSFGGCGGAANSCNPFAKLAGGFPFAFPFGGMPGPVMPFPGMFGGEGQRNVSELFSNLGKFTAEEEVAEVDGKVVHKGVTCDGCKASPIVGCRFKCTTCANYDLCDSCESQGVHSEHSFLKMKVASGNSGCHFGGAGNANTLFELLSKMQPKPVPKTEDVKEADVLSAEFLADVNIDDGTSYNRADLPSLVMKTWKIKNNGNVAWPEGTVLKYLSGNAELCFQEEFVVPTANPGEEVDVNAVINLPRKVGHYRTTFQLAVNEKVFGNAFWIDVNVV